MKTSRLVGLLVLAGIAIGAILSAVLPDFGIPGLGSGIGAGNPPANPPAATGVDAPETMTKTTDDAMTDAAPQQHSPPAAVVYVLIDGRNYLLRRGPEGKAPFQPATLEAVVAAAQEAAGDDNGIRVRISQKSSSRELTERALRAKLDEAGIPRDAIRWKDEPVDSE